MALHDGVSGASSHLMCNPFAIQTMRSRSNLSAERRLWGAEQYLHIDWSRPSVISASGHSHTLSRLAAQQQSHPW